MKKQPNLTNPEEVKELKILLDQKNRELEIEAALDRVRALTMIMKKSDELSEIIITVYKELRQLDMALTRTLIWLCSENPDTFEVWLADSEADKSPFAMKTQVEHPYHKRMFREWKKRKPKWAYINKGEEKQDLDNYLFTKTAAAALPEEVKAGIRAVDKIVNSFSFHNFGALQADGDEKLSEENFEILYRFAKEFDLAYTRFLDLQKAEAQAREAQIEAALESVRAVAMGMNQPGDMIDVCRIISEQLQVLKVENIRNVQTAIINDEKGTYLNYEFFTQYNTTSIIEVKSNLHPKVLEFVNSIKKSKDAFFTTQFKGKDLEDWIAYRRKTNQNADPILEKAKSVHYYFYSIGPGALGLSTYVPLNSKQLDVFRRFHNVFMLAYNRFMDIKKAEAQAREAEIQLALERVRARTMAMQDSVELMDVLKVLYRQFDSLGIANDMTDIEICLIDEDTGVYTVWQTHESLTGDEGNLELPITASTQLKKEFTAWKKTPPEQRSNLFFHHVLENGELKNFLSKLKMLEGWEHVLDIFKKNKIKRWVTCNAYFQYGMLTYQNVEKKGSEIDELLPRFAKVFEQTYTRFLDLQKAEAQAREAEIEVALERMRAQMLAMHTSSDMEKACIVMYEQLNALGIVPESAAVYIAVLDRKTDTAIQWLVSDKTLILPFDEERTPLTEHKLLIETYNGWKRKDPVLIRDISGEELKDFGNYLQSLPWNQRSKVKSENMPDRLIWTEATFSHGTVGFIHTLPLPEADIEILIRFSRVFDLTYTRFLDLQKAEAQAREAKIEAALERIRNRSLLMLDSGELNEVVAVLFQELSSLGLLPPESRTYFCDINSQTHEAEVWMTYTNGKVMSGSHITPLTKSASMKKYYNAWKLKEPINVREYKGKNLNTYLSFISTLAHVKKDMDYRKLLKNPPKKIVMTDANFLQGNIGIMTFESLSQEALDILVRFAKVFEFTYTRFLDLKKAEAQAREAQVEAALERVRSRSMAMHKSDDLQEIIHLVFKEIKKLGIEPDSCIIHLNQPGNYDINMWISNQDRTYSQLINIPYTDHPIMADQAKARKDGADFFSNTYAKEEKDLFFNWAFENSDLKVAPQKWKDRIRNGAVYIRSMALNKHTAIGLNNYKNIPFYKDENEILKRFGKVFEQTYTRFLDLQKAEAQAKEAQIEAALERVRAASMAMHKSDDMMEVVNVLFEQLKSTGIDATSSWIVLTNLENNTLMYWIRHSDQKSKAKIVHVNDNIVFKEILESSRAEVRTLNDVVSKTLFFKILQQFFGFSAPDRSDRENYHLMQILHKYGYLGLGTWDETGNEERDICLRFTKVFEQTYTRFLDLQKAEAQAREAQIEAALERIRAKALAMQSSSDLHGVSMVLREQMGMLGQQDLESSIVHLYNSAESLESWYTFRSTKTNSEKIVTDVAFIPVDSCEYIKETIRKYKSKESEYTIVSKGKKLADWYNVMEKVAPDTIEYDKDGKILVPKILYYHHSKFSGGALLLISNQPPSDESKELQRRAARVFNFAYQRFLDLKKAEFQAREAQIEAALERVRSKAMAMQQSEDLSQSVATTLDELEKLKLQIQRCGVGIFTENKTAQLWTTTHTDEGKQAIVLGELPLMKHPMMKGSYNAWVKKQGYSYILEGDELRAYYDMLLEEGFALPAENIKKAKSIERQYYHYFTFQAGGLYVFSNQVLSATDGKIVQRFADVFHLAFTRYLDLQKAEARAVEAIKEASLDRVRAEIASMRTADDLQRITPLVWSELTTLGVPFIRCGVFIMDDAKAVMQSYLSTPDGKSLGVYDLPYGSTEIAKNLLQKWKSKKAYKEHWDKDQFLKFMETMAKRGLIQNQQVYQGDAKPPESLDLHFIPFKQGMLYAGNIAPLSEEELFLVKSLAEAFSIAYARYEDFTKLEHAKNQIENTLGELKSTQTQLIHAEKMASLGELTAGIAHEIQNPLNFVNNFSEVSKELLEEMDEELENGNIDDVREISEDIKQNLDKINHHGQRASSIVKGMLEHSRTGDKQKELADINALADEYLRLAYHGLRAKDKSFNADFAAELDESLPKIKVISQDIGRVLLNLINNAFYAVSENAARHSDPERSQGVESGAAVAQESYKPKVVVITKKNDHMVEISVEDNGGGIPKQVLDKIFQPFFTTKPTGSGTGLGLSLSYDIVTKGHDGHLEVETEEGIGSRFIIRLPITEMR